MQIQMIFTLSGAMSKHHTPRPHNTTLTISKNSGMVKEGTCTCSASGLGRCAHVASLLFAIEDFISKFGYDPLTCTQKLCEWNKGRRKDKKPSAVFDIKYPSMKKELKQQRSAADFVMNADPRPTSLRSDKISHCALNAFLVNLQFANSSDCGWTNLLEFKYEDFTVSEYGGDVLKYQCNQFQETLEKACGNEREPFCVERTEQQAAALEWQSNRWCRITASFAKSAICVKTGMKGILQNHLWTADDIHNAALQYGKENEGSALKAYADENPTLVVQSTGSWINPKYPQLAASPDGIVTDSVSGDDGLVEIKCPYVLRNTHPSKSKENLSTKQSNNFFCTCMDDGSLKLNKSHAQMQLHVTEKSFCDFVVWSSKGIFQDNTMWKYIYPKLQTFHKEYLVPEFFLNRIPRELQPLKFSY